MEMTNHYNNVYLAGTLKTRFLFHHTYNCKDFYSAVMEVDRLSGTKDAITIIAPKDMILQKKPGTYVQVYGSMRSYNKKQRMNLNMIAKDMQVLKNRLVSPVENNRISVCGEIIKAPIYRKTPLGTEITELLLAVERSNGKCDYLPCICWGCTARDASHLTKQCTIEVTGRIQSREYVKKTHTTEIRTVNEISIGRIEPFIPKA